MKPKSENIIKTIPKITLEDKEKLLQQKGMVLWMTGLSGSGKSTIAHLVEKELYSEDKLVVVLDGDNVRHGLNSDLGFSSEDRKENLRRIAEVAKLFSENGLIVITSFISPTNESRERAREVISQAVPFFEIYVKCNIEECSRRDPKGLYKKVEAGEIKNFTGVDAPFVEPQKADLVLDTEEETCEKSVSRMRAFIEKRVLSNNC